MNTIDFVTELTNTLDNAGYLQDVTITINYNTIYITSNTGINNSVIRRVVMVADKAEWIYYVVDYKGEPAIKLVNTNTYVKANGGDISKVG